MRLVRKFKNKPKAKKFRITNGVKNQVLNIGGRELEVKVAGQTEIDEMKADFKLYRTNKKAYKEKFQV